MSIKLDVFPIIGYVWTIWVLETRRWVIIPNFSDSSNNLGPWDGLYIGLRNDPSRSTFDTERALVLTLGTFSRYS
jgi:hypothetical protein